MEEVYVFKRYMYNTVIEILERYLLVWQANLGLKADVDEVKAKLVIINKKAVFDKRTEGATAGKNQKLDEMCEGCLIICNSGYRYGSKIKNNNIKKSFDYSLSDIKKGSEVEIHIRCTEITASALPIETILTATYDLPIAFLADQDIRNSDFFELIDVAGRIIDHGKSTKEEMVDEYHEVDLIFNERIDKAIFTFKGINSDFYKEYTNGRIIGNRHHPPKPFVPPLVPPVDPIPPAE